MEPGATIGGYRVVSSLGAGGMGEVWRAEDERLGRQVALKVLPAELADDPIRVDRFEREARVLASLNHPNIAHLYGLESVASGADADAGATTFLVMELVDGDDLSDRIARGPVPTDDAISIALQIAEALEAAHEAGIVHRDLKPANVKLRRDGTVKVLDFGLAKVWEVEAGDGSLSVSPTLTQHATLEGVILGTAAYMSPEQARGHEVDRRTDVWAFGVVLWEMLTGRKLFEGDTVTDVLASVLKEPPDLDALPNATPAAIRRLIGRCLERDPRSRLQWIGDARVELEEVGRQPVTSDPTMERRDGAGVPKDRRREWAAWTIAAVAMLLALIAALGSDDRDLERVTRFSVALDESRRLSFIDVPLLDLSPDGRAIAFTAIDDGRGREMVFVRRFDEEAIRLIEGTEGATHPFFSPDGSEIAFFSDGLLMKVPVEGGSPVRLAEAPTPRGGAWLPDDTIVFSPEYSAGLLRVDGDGGPPQTLVELDTDAGERTYRFPDVIPGGEALVFTVGMMDSPNNYDEAKIVVFDPSSGRRDVIIDGANMARWVDNRTLLFARAGVLFAVAFDPKRLETIGQPVPVLEDVGGDPSSGATHFAAADNGGLVWVTGAVTESDARLTLVDREGQPTRLPLEPRGFYEPRFSPDGSRIAVAIGEGRSGVDGDVWIYSIASETLNRLTFDGNGLYPTWTWDGDRIGFLSYLVNPSVLLRDADGRGGEETFTVGGVSPIFPESFSPDGSTLAYTQVGQSSDVYLVTQGGEPRLFEQHASSPVFSPDGRWIAYSSPGSGSSSIYVRSVDGNGKWQISPDLGGYPRWSGDGRSLFYIDIGTAKRPLMEVEIEEGEGFRYGAPKVVISDLGGRFVTTTAPANNWDVAPDAQSFIFVEFERDERSRGRIEVALNWAQNLGLEGR